MSLSNEEKYIDKKKFDPVLLSKYGTIFLSGSDSLEET